MTNEQIAAIAHEIFRQHRFSQGEENHPVWDDLAAEHRAAKIERVDQHLERLARGEDITDLGESAEEKVEAHILAHVVMQALSGRSKTEAA